jgi:hypothetical protein
MSTSGTYSFTVNRDQIIRDAMLNLGKLDESEAPTSAEMADGSFKLNMLIKQWQGKGDMAPGLKVWTRRRGHLFLSNVVGQYLVGPTVSGWTTAPIFTTVTVSAIAGAANLTLASTTGAAAGYYIGIQLANGGLFWTTLSGPAVGLVVPLTTVLPSAVNAWAMVVYYAAAAQQPIKIEAAILRDAYNSDVPLKIMQSQDYDYLPNKTDPTNLGDPSAIYYEFQLGNSILYVDVGACQDVTKHIVLTFMEPVQDMNSATDNFEYPQEWFLALSWGLAKQMAPMFNAPWTQTMETNYREALGIAQRKDPEIQTMFFQPGADD